MTNSEANDEQHLLLFDPYAGGHHADHVRWLWERWKQRGLPGRLTISTPDATADDLPELRALAPSGRVRFDPFGAPVRLNGPLGLVGAAIDSLRRLRRAVRTHCPTHAAVMYLDHMQVALASRVRVGAPVSGLLFRPSHHYPIGAPASVPRPGALRKRTVLRAALRHPEVHALMTLDPTAVDPIRALAPRGVDVVHVPDPAPPASGSDESREQARSRLGVRPDQTLLLMFGALGERKGAYALLDAIARLPEETARRAAVVFAGRPFPGEEKRLDTALRDTEAARPEARIVRRLAFITEAETGDLFTAADVVLAPYLGHVGSSGILMRAAGAGRPVLSQADGLMGWQTAAHRLGRTVDASDPEALAEALTAAITDPCGAFDPERAAALAAAHTVEAFADAFLDAALGLDTAS